MNSAKQVRLTSSVAQAAGLFAADMDGEKVMLNIETGKYYGLDSIGSRIWELIERPAKVGELVQVLRSAYDVAEPDCQNDVVAFLNKLCQEGLVDIV